MQNYFVVKNKKAHRIGLWVMLVFFIVLSVFMIVYWMIEEWKIMLLLVLPPNFFFFLFVFYYETWRVVFYEDKICKKVFFINIRTFYYSRIKDAYMNNCYILVVKYTDGKMMLIDMEYENFDKAMSRIGIYHSIRNM